MKILAVGAHLDDIEIACGGTLAKAIEATPVQAPRCPIYQNVTALPETDPERIRKNLLAQLTSPVRWTQSVRNMIADGAEEFVEFGPGTVLQGLIKRIMSSLNPA